MSKGAVAVKAKTELSTDVLGLLGEVEGQGVEFDTKDLQMPFLRLAQDLTPQVKKSKAEYVEGLEPGMFFNTVTREIYKDVTVIPLKFEHRLNEWIPRAQGGGIVRSYLDSDPDLPEVVRREKGTGILENGNELQDALQYLVLQIDDNDNPIGLAILSFGGTQLKKARAWNSAIAQFKVDTGDRVIRPPIYAAAYLVEATPESRQQNDYWGVKIGPPTLLSNVELLKFAKQQYELFKVQTLAADVGEQKHDGGLQAAREVM